MYTIYWLKSIDGIKLRLKRSVRTAGSVKLEELRSEIAVISITAPGREQGYKTWISKTS